MGKNKQSAHQQKESKEEKKAFPAFNKAYQNVVQEIVAFLTDQETVALRSANRALGTLVCKAPYAVMSNASSTDSGTLATGPVLSFEKFTGLKSRVSTYNKILRKLKEIKAPELTVARAIFNITPENFRQSSSILGAIAIGFCINTYVFSAVNSGVHSAIGGNVFGNVLCAAFVVIFDGVFGAFSGEFMGEKTGKFNNQAYNGEMFGIGLGLLHGVTSGIYFGVKNILSDYGLISDVSFKLMDDKTANYLLAGMIIVSICGLYANKKIQEKKTNQSPEALALKKKANDELSDARNKLKDFTRIR